MIQRERIHLVNEQEVANDGQAVVYWMQQAQRAEFNHALEYAIYRANELKLPVVVIFGLTPSYPEANARHYQFMLEGLVEVVDALKKRGVQMILKWGEPDLIVEEFLNKIKCALLVCDRGYLNLQRLWRKNLQKKLKLRVMEVETDVVVPVEVVSDHEEFAARTIRSKITRQIPNYLKILKPLTVEKTSLKMDLGEGIDLKNITALVASLKVDQSVQPVEMRGGRSQAVKYLKEFLTHKANRYADDRNQPGKAALSMMSPYLHFGQISSLEIALRVKGAADKGLMAKEAAEVYLEELIVRRELSMNFCHFNKGYDRYEKALPTWAQATLEKHAADKRPYLYSREKLELAKTHDPIWNACQNEMVRSGKMHGYMRMYWGKKILEWMASPQEAYETALYLNDKYELDGRDANGFTGVAWCFGKHDRPWGPERPIFGLVRYMNDAGIKRKIKDWQEYVAKWS